SIPVGEGGVAGVEARRQLQVARVLCEHAAAGDDAGAVAARTLGVRRRRGGGASGLVGLALWRATPRRLLLADRSRGKTLIELAPRKAVLIGEIGLLDRRP